MPVNRDRRTKINLNKILFLGILSLVVSCNLNNKKENPEPELSKIIFELQALGGFEKAEYQLFGESKTKISNQKTIKITFSNTDLKDLDIDQFGKNSAQKIYNLNTKTRNFETVWISIAQEGKEILNTIEIRSAPNLTLKMNVKEQNLVYQSSELAQK